MGIHVYLILTMRIITKHSLEEQKHRIFKKTLCLFPALKDIEEPVHKNSKQGKTVQI